MMLSKNHILVLFAWLMLELATALTVPDRSLQNALGSARTRWRRGAGRKCTLPPQPEHGSYNITGGTIVGGKASVINLLYSCDQSYEMVGEPAVFCWGGIWNALELPKCVQACKLVKHRSVQYNCIISGTDNTRACKDVEVEGTVIQPTCNKPYYYTPLELPYMVCKRGQWNAWSTCIPECGIFIEDVETGVVPWQAAIYYKDKVAASHEHVCSGTLISNSVVLTAARCFWDEGLKEIKDESYYAVAVGKLNSEWEHPDDEVHAQKSDVKKIAVPSGYSGPDGEGDLAVVVVSRAFDYALRVRPACLDFKREMLEQHLSGGSVGKTASWAAVNEVSNATRLRTLDLPFVSKGDCTTRASEDGKFCAGFPNGPALCGADSGSGATFSATIQNTTRQYLRGVAAGPCGALTTFTAITKHQHLIKTYWFL
ncbi:unnamed protein product, partial [Iphiclides podalirius]